MRNGYIFDTLTSVEIQEIDKIGAKETETYEGVIYRENFRVSPFRKVTDKLVALSRNIRIDRNIDVMQLLLNLLMKRSYAGSIRKEIANFACKSEYWMMTEYDERVEDCWKNGYGFYIVKMIN